MMFNKREYHAIPGRVGLWNETVRMDCQVGVNT